jgi:hypothetical protein
MLIVDTPHGAVVLDWRGYHKMNLEKLHQRLYGSFVERSDKPEDGTTELRGEDTTYKEANNDGTGMG